MDKIEKLLRKIKPPERQKLLDLVELLSRQDKGLKISKIKKTDFYRVRYGKFRIIFHKEKGEVVIDSIRMRNENTYKNL